MPTMAFIQQLEQKVSKVTKGEGERQNRTMSRDRPFFVLRFVGFCSPLPSPAIQSSSAFGATQPIAGVAGSAHVGCGAHWSDTRTAARPHDHPLFAVSVAAVSFGRG